VKYRFVALVKVGSTIQLSATAYSQGNHNHRVSGRFSAASPPPVTPPPRGEFVFNNLRLGAKWFEQDVTEEVVRLLIHEFGHQCGPDYLAYASTDVGQGSLVRSVLDGLDLRPSLRRNLSDCRFGII